jgi:hypothetical protein
MPSTFFHTIRPSGFFDLFHINHPAASQSFILKQFNILYYLLPTSKTERMAGNKRAAEAMEDSNIPPSKQALTR